MITTFAALLLSNIWRTFPGIDWAPYRLSVCLNRQGLTVHLSGVAFSLSRPFG